MSRRIADLLIKIGADSYEFRQKAAKVENTGQRIRAVVYAPSDKNCENGLMNCK